MYNVKVPLAITGGICRVRKGLPWQECTKMSLSD